MFSPASHATSRVSRSPKRTTGSLSGARRVCEATLSRARARIAASSSRAARETFAISVYGASDRCVGRVEDAVEVGAVEREITGVVKVSESLRRPIDSLDRYRRLGMLDAVRYACRVGKMKRVDLDEHDPSERYLLDDVSHDRPPDRELLYVDAVQVLKISERRLEERPLIALEVWKQREAHARQRIEPQRVQQLDPEVDVAVGLGPGSIGRVKRV